MSGLFLLAMLFVCLLLGVPIAVSLGFASIVTLMVFADQSLLSLALRFFHTMQVYPLLAIPFFILAGTLMTSGGVARRMIDFADACVGHMHGGLAMASVLACMLFAAVSGSSPATVVAIGSIVIAGMINLGYTKKFAAGVICNAGTLGILIPPSIVLVVGTRGLDRCLYRLCARIGEEHRIRESLVDQHLGKLFTLRTAIEIGDMHQRLGLALDRSDQPGMAVPQQVDRDTAGEVEIARAVFVDQMAVLTLDRAHPAAGIDGHQRCNRHGSSSGTSLRVLSRVKDKWRSRKEPPFACLSAIYCVSQPGSNRIARSALLTPERVRG